MSGQNIFMGRDNTDPLQHWKYIRKYRKNGEWRYVYENDKFGVKNYIDTKITGKAYKQHGEEAGDELTKTNNRLQSTTQARIHAEQTSKGYSQDDPKVKALKKEENSLSNKSKELKKQTTNANYNYYHRSLKGATESSIKRGKRAVAAVLEKLAKKLG